MPELIRLHNASCAICRIDADSTIDHDAAVAKLRELGCTHPVEGSPVRLAVVVQNDLLAP